MAKDHLSGQVSNPDGGFYKSSEEVRAEAAERLTRSEIINSFGDDLGQKLLDGGYSSLSSLVLATDKELLAVEGVGPAALSKILEVISTDLEPEVGDGLEEEPAEGLEVETADEPEVEEAVDGESETAEPVVTEAPDQEVSEEVLPEEPTEGVEPEPAPAPAPAPEPAPAPVEEVPFGAPGAMSVRVRRNKERAAKEEEERVRLAAVQDGLSPPEVAEEKFDLGSVDVDFVPEPDPVVVPHTLPEEIPEPETEPAPEPVAVPPSLPEGDEGGTEPVSVEVENTDKEDQNDDPEVEVE